jgi:hypothetical protein
MTWTASTAALLLSLFVMTAPVAAQRRPDLSGFWTLDVAKIEDDPALIAKLPANTVMVRDTGIVEFGIGDYGGLKLKPHTLEEARQWKPEDEMSLSRVCTAPSIVYAIQGPFPFEIHQTPQLIIFKYEYFDQVRLIFMDGRTHPPATAPHSKTGHSIGHWEKDELVIDTTHLAPSTITNNGLNHSDKVHMVERYKLARDGKTLIATQWFEDPDRLDNHGARTIQWRKRPGNFVFPYDCDPSFAVQYQQMEKPATAPR